MFLLTLPNTTCLPSRWGYLSNKIKNEVVFVLGPLLAIDNRPLLSCFISKFSSAK